MTKYYKIVVFVPLTDAERICEVLAGAGRIGNYDNCTFSVKGVGRFRPLPGARPVIGEVGKLEEVEEERMETVVSAEELEDAVFQVRRAHPYEEPVIEVYELVSIA